MFRIFKLVFTIVSSLIHIPLHNSMRSDLKCHLNITLLYNHRSVEWPLFAGSILNFCKHFLPSPCELHLQFNHSNRHIAWDSSKLWCFLLCSFSHPRVPLSYVLVSSSNLYSPALSIHDLLLGWKSNFTGKRHNRDGLGAQQTCFPKGIVGGGKTAEAWSYY